jgi:hypothetical protein
MGLRFYKSFRVGKSMRINLSKGGLSASGGLGNTGLRWTTGKYGGAKRQSRAQAEGNSSAGGCLVVLVAVALIGVFLLAVLASFNPETQSPPEAVQIEPLARP